MNCGNSRPRPLSPHTTSNVDECKAQCTASDDCKGFVHVLTGQHSIKCYYRQVITDEPYAYTDDTRNCYIKRSTTTVCDTSTTRTANQTWCAAQVLPGGYPVAINVTSSASRVDVFVKLQPQLVHGYSPGDRHWDWRVFKGGQTPTTLPLDPIANMGIQDAVLGSAITDATFYMDTDCTVRIPPQSEGGGNVHFSTPTPVRCAQAADQGDGSWSDGVMLQYTFDGWFWFTAAVSPRFQTHVSVETPPWFYFARVNGTVSQSVPVRCAAESGLIECASSDGTECLWQTVTQGSTVPEIYAVLQGYKSTVSHVLPCPAWADHTGGDPCEKLECYPAGKFGLQARCIEGMRCSGAATKKLGSGLCQPAVPWPLSPPPGKDWLSSQFGKLCAARPWIAHLLLQHRGLQNC